MSDVTRDCQEIFQRIFCDIFLTVGRCGTNLSQGSKLRKSYEKILKQICGAKLWAICQGGQNWEKLEKIVVGPICEQFAKGVAGK